MTARLLKLVDTFGCNIFGPMFIGGKSIEEVLTCGKLLKREGYRVTYNLLGEHVRDPVLIDYALRTTIDLIDKMDKTNKGNVALKPTLYGLELSSNYFYESALRIINHAKCVGVEIEFDAEGYKYIEDTFRVFNIFASRLEYRGFVRQCVQAHLRFLPKLMDQYSLWNKPIRVVKGSGVYEESDDITINSEKEVITQYKYVARRNIQNGLIPFVATVRDKKIFEFFSDKRNAVIQTLYGPLGRKRRESFLKSGVEIQIYVPFVDKKWCKDAWKEYGFRRSGMMRRLIWEETKNFRKQRY